MRDLGWYAARIRAMSVRELAFRAGQLASRAREWGGWKIGGAATGAGAALCEPAETVVRRMLDANERPFLPLVAQWPQARAAGDAIPQCALGTIADADRLMNGEWTLFGRTITVADEPDWHRDPFTGRTWPRTFYAFVDHRAGAKATWELARFQLACALARAFLWTGEPRYAARAVALLRSWIRHNPTAVGIHWTSPVECALRLISWTLIFHATRLSGAWDEPAVADLLGAIAVQARFVAAHPSRYSSANNHRVAEAASLATVGICFPELREAGAWRRDGLHDLQAELPRQILPDGAGAEQAPYYLACVVDYGLWVHALLAAEGTGLDGLARRRLVAAGRFLERLSAGAERTPRIGDEDDSRAVSLDDERVSVYDGARIGAAAMFGAGEPKRSRDVMLERVYWLGGLEGARAFAELPALALPPASETFPDGGTTIIVTPGGSSRAVVDHGPLGYMSIAAHGHADALSLQLEVAGQQLIADPGTYLYHEAPEWRHYFHGTRAHSTICVADTDQSESLGDTLWGRRANVTTECVSLGGADGIQCVAARHDGYAPLGVIHRRSVLAVREDYWLTVDWLLGEAIPRAELLWHFTAAARIEGAGLAWRATMDGVERCIALGATREPSVRVARGEEMPPLGWASARYGERHSVQVIVTAMPAGPPWCAATAIGAVVDRVTVERRHDGATIVTVFSGRVVDELSWQAFGTQAPYEFRRVER